MQSFKSVRGQRKSRPRFKLQSAPYRARPTEPHFCLVIYPDISTVPLRPSLPISRVPLQPCIDPNSRADAPLSLSPSTTRRDGLISFHSDLKSPYTSTKTTKPTTMNTFLTARTTLITLSDIYDRTIFLLLRIRIYQCFPTAPNQPSHSP